MEQACVMQEFSGQRDARPIATGKEKTDQCVVANRLSKNTLRFSSISALAIDLGHMHTYTAVRTTSPLGALFQWIVRESHRIRSPGSVSTLISVQSGCR
jgi:hypothetical protein